MKHAKKNLFLNIKYIPLVFLVQYAENLFLNKQSHIYKYLSSMALQGRNLLSVLVVENKTHREKYQ